MNVPNVLITAVVSKTRWVRARRPFFSFIYDVELFRRAKRTHRDVNNIIQFVRYTKRL